jgi:hypothetical protein
MYSIPTSLGIVKGTAMKVPLAKRAFPPGALIGLIVSLLACGMLAALAVRVRPDELAAARVRWNAHAFRRYRLVVNEETAAGSCRQDVQVENEQITSVVLNECVRIPSWTVSTLFTWAAGLDPYSSRCYPSAVTCVCYAIYTAQTRFDPQFGYPQQIVHRWNLKTNWAYFGHWERLWRTHELPNCSGVAHRLTDHITVRVVSLSQLP